MKKLIFLLSAVVIFSSCKVTFTPSQSPEAIDKINTILVTGTNIFTSTDLSYASHESEIADVSNKIADLIALDLTRKKDILITADQTLFNGFVELANDYKESGTITQTVEANYNSRFKSYVHARQIIENSLPK